MRDRYHAHEIGRYTAEDKIIRKAVDTNSSVRACVQRERLGVGSNAIGGSSYCGDEPFNDIGRTFTVPPYRPSIFLGCQPMKYDFHSRHLSFQAKLRPRNCTFGIRESTIEFFDDFRFIGRTRQRIGRHRFEQSRYESQSLVLG
jgi:hypothetical protein